MSNNRKYNVFFHLHTVSGISITLGLFVCFFGGAFALFKNEIRDWENSGKVIAVNAETRKLNNDYVFILAAIGKKVPHMYGRTIYGRKNANSDKNSFYVSETSDTTAGKKGEQDFRFSFNPSTKKLETQAENFSFGELLYLLHFYYQLDRIGYYISGFVALFFFLAILTGVIIHWKKVFSNFFVFRPRQKMKTIWTDAHTALGFIGLPFQFIYALTGSMFGLGILVASSNGLWVYKGDTEKMYNDISPREARAELGKKEKSSINLNELISQTEHKWTNFKVNGFKIEHFGSSSMTVEINGEQHISSKFLGHGNVVYDYKGKELAVHRPGEIDYYDGVWESVERLHYARFGNIGSVGSYLLKLVYFVMALITCFVIITGVLIWLEARNKKNITEKKKRYNKRVGLIYLSVCLSMLPVTAGVFILSKILPESASASRESILNYSFFLGWLGISIFFILLRNNYLTNKISLILTVVLGLFVPIVNGFVSGTWMWSNYASGEYGVFSIDLIWTLTALVSLLVVFKLKGKKALQPAQ